MTLIRLGKPRLALVLAWSVKHLALIALALASCDLSESSGEPDARADAEVGPDGEIYPYPAPATNLVPALGADNTLEIATWNLENYPATSETPAVVADLITSMDLDIVVLQEIASEQAFTELVERLRHYDAVLSPHRYTPTDYQKIAVLSKREVATVVRDELILVTESYNFPRPPLRVDLTVGDLSFALIGLHLKAGVQTEDAERRAQAVVNLDNYMQAEIAADGETQFVVLGDYNEVVDTSEGETVLAPFFSQPAPYTVRSDAAGDAGQVSFLPADIMLDHITTTAALDPSWASAVANVVPLSTQLPSYQSRVSDHQPVVLVVPR